MSDKITSVQFAKWLSQPEKGGPITLTIPGDICNLPNDIVVHMDSQYRPLGQRDTETAVWIRQNLESGFHADVKLFLRQRWVVCSQFTVTYKAPVSMGKGNNSVWVTRTMTLAESYAGLTKRARLVYSPVGSTIRVESAAGQTV